MQHRKRIVERTIPIAVAAVAGPTDAASGLLRKFRPGLVFEAAGNLRRVRRLRKNDRFSTGGAGK
jgi:hypothetical protein